MPEKPRPSVFVGSSAEGLDYAKAIQRNLDYVAEVAIWSQGLFGLSAGTLEDLTQKIRSFDFAVLVLTPDDVVESREEKQDSPRDNVLFELGLCMGALGRDRTFIVYDRAKSLKLPSDLAGVTAATFQEHGSNDLTSSLGAASTQIETRINDLGLRSDISLSGVVDLETTYQVMSGLLDNASKQFLIWMQREDVGLPRRTGKSLFRSLGLRYRFRMSGGVQSGNGYFSMHQFCEKVPDADILQVDLRDLVTLTDRGREFAVWLAENGHCADFFSVDTHLDDSVSHGWGVPDATDIIAPDRGDDTTRKIWVRGNPEKKGRATRRR